MLDTLRICSWNTAVWWLLWLKKDGVPVKLNGMIVCASVTMRPRDLSGWKMLCAFLRMFV